jgi:glycosyltransferase involved in cell wall biosynthesis
LGLLFQGSIVFSSMPPPAVGGRLPAPTCLRVVSFFLRCGRSARLGSSPHDTRREQGSELARARVYHGLPDDLYRFHPEPGGYLAFLGRICAEKGVGQAIAIAQRAGIPLQIAAKVDAADEAYFESEIRQLLDDPLVEFIGEIGDGDKEALLGGAAALRMPINWPEPFGLVVIEAIACGTPVIAFPFGSMPELIEPSVNGALVDSTEQAVSAVEALAALDRRACRRSFEERFTAARMAENYVNEGLRSPLTRRRRAVAR